MYKVGSKVRIINDSRGVVYYVVRYFNHACCGDCDFNNTEDINACLGCEEEDRNYHVLSEDKSGFHGNTNKKNEITLISDSPITQIKVVK